MIDRREFLTHSLLATSALSVSPAALFSAQPTGSQPPTRFIFVHKGNGLLPESLVPPSFDKQQLEGENRKDACDVDLDGHDLPNWMNPIAAHRDNLTLLQGLSGKMCTTGHHTWCSSLGAFKANERLNSIKWATVDFELAKLFPSPFEHIELACFPDGGGNARGNINGIEKDSLQVGQCNRIMLLDLRRLLCRNCLNPFQPMKQHANAMNSNGGHCSFSRPLNQISLVISVALNAQKSQITPTRSRAFVDAIYVLME